MTEKEVIIAIVGKNRPGVLAEVTGEVGRLNGNIMDITQKVLQGFFNLIMVVDVTKLKVKVQTLKERLEIIGENSGYKVTVQHKKVFQFMHRI